MFLLERYKRSAIFLGFFSGYPTADHVVWQDEQAHLLLWGEFAFVLFLSNQVTTAPHSVGCSYLSQLIIENYVIWGNQPSVNVWFGGGIKCRYANDLGFELERSYHLRGNESVPDI